MDWARLLYENGNVYGVRPHRPVSRFPILHTMVIHNTGKFHLSILQ